MKALNNKTIRKEYFHFSGYFILTVMVTVSSLYFFMKTSSIEVKKISEKTEEYDRIYTRQLSLIQSVDSIYEYMSLLNTSPKINDLLLQNVISKKKISLQDNLNSMDERDCMIYKKLVNDLNIFLRIKDSIRMVSIQESLIREDLLRCVDENKQISRKLSVGGLIFEKK